MGLLVCFFVLAARRLVLAVAVVLWGGLAAPIAAQTLSELNAKAVAAFNAGDVQKALGLTFEVINKGTDAGRAEPAAYLEALNNLVFLTTREGDVPTEALAQAEDAVTFAQDAQQLGTPGGLLALSNAAWVNTRLGNPTRARVLRDQLLQYHRGGAGHGQAVSASVDLAFENRDILDVPHLIEEMIKVAGGYFAAMDLDAMLALQNELEAQGDVAGVSALVDARILWVGAAQPSLRDEFAHQMLWKKFYLNYEAEQFGAAAEALRVWATTGTLAPEEAAFIQTQAEAALTLTQLQGFGDRAGVQLGYSELTLAFAQLAYPPEDPRISLALREVAYAQSQLGLYAQAAETLQDALLILSQSEGSSNLSYLILEDLASNAWQRGALAQAHQLFQRADTAYQAALTNGAEPLADMERSILSLNRAKLDLERGSTAEAAMFLKQAKDSFARYTQSGTAKKNDLWHHVDLAETQALLAAEISDQDSAIKAAEALVESARRYYPATHPARARALSNAADQLFVLAQTAQAQAALEEALTIARVALPENATLTSEVLLKQAYLALSTGAHQDAIALFRQITQARRAPEFRETLAQVASDFEIFAWLLLSQPNPTRADLGEALAALQWTQTSQSAEAHAMMAARLAEQDPGAATLIKKRQDAALSLARNRSTLNAVYAAGEDPSAVLARQARLQDQLTQADGALRRAGMALTGQAGISALDLTDIQGQLDNDEVLVTFLLPSLSATAIPGVEHSSNLAIAIRKDAYVIAQIPEGSRKTLNQKIDAFRCEMAISDEGCGRAIRAQLRGKMSFGAPKERKPSFDWDVAHALYRDLFGGIEPMLRAKDHLIIVPPSDLLRLPFQALLTERTPLTDLDTAKWLITQHAISVLPSIAAFDVLKSSAPAVPRSAKFLGVGDPVIGNRADMACEGLALAGLRAAGAAQGSLYASQRIDGIRVADTAQLRAMQRLPDATCELRAIERAYGSGQSNVLVQEAATETALKQLSASGALASYDVIVFATHGVVAGETSAVAPGLVLSPPNVASLEDDGLLTAAEVAGLSLAARLVILSACNTAAGEGEGEGLSGLATGFFHAGAQSLMVTHWAVYSDASAEVSAQLSTLLARDTALPVARGLRRVVLGFLEGEGPARTKHPAYWAPFTTVGI